MKSLRVPDRVAITALHIPNVIPGDVRKFGDEGARKRAPRGVIDAAKMTAYHLEKREIGPCLGLEWVVDDIVEEREEGRDWYCCHYT